MTQAAKIAIAIAVVLVLGTVMYMIGRNDASPEGPLVGGDRDARGCIGSAGYSWCEAKQKCTRQWEEYCTATAQKVAAFTCNNGKTVTATFYPGDDKYVDLAFSDGKKISVPRDISASGARYAKADESFVFWNKGDTAFVTENGTSTYEGCVLQEN